MRTTQQLCITLPKELAATVKEMVDSGESASESEVIREGLRALMGAESRGRPLAARRSWAGI